MRVRMGPTRDCNSPTSRFTFSVVRRIWKYNAARIVSWRTTATAVTAMNTANHVCIPTPRAPQKGQNPSTTLLPAHPASGLRLPEIGLAASLDRGRNRIFLARRHLLAALDQIVRAFA